MAEERNEERGRMRGVGWVERRRGRIVPHSLSLHDLSSLPSLSQN